ncbi:MAG: sensor domain-containing protein [Pseudomonadota bacterium]
MTRARLPLEVELRFTLTRPARLDAVSGPVAHVLGASAAWLHDPAVPVSRRFHPGDADLVEPLFDPGAPVREGECHLRLRDPEGHIRCLRARYLADPGTPATLYLWLADAHDLADPDALNKMPASLRSMLENTDDFIYFKDRHHVFTGASQTLVSLTAPARHWSELIGLTDYEVFPEPYADAYYQLEKAVFAGAPVAREVQEYLTPDGRKGWVDNRKYPIHDDAGTIIGLFGVARDITDKILADQALRRERAAMQLILDNAPIGIWLQDGQGKLSVVNRAFCQAMGIEAARFLSVPHYGELIPADFREQCLRSDDKALASDGVSITHQQLPFVDGRIHDLRVIKVVKRDELGAPVALVGLSIDITDELRREEALRRERDTSKNILDTVEAIIVALDRDGHITLINRKGAELLGWPADALIGQDWFETCLPPSIDVEAVRAVYRKALADDLGGSEYYENPVLTRTGEQRLIAWHNSSIRDASGLIVGGLSAGEDITERRRAEQALRLNEERLRLALSASNQAWFDLDLTTGAVQVSPEYPALIGYPPGDFHSSLDNWLAHIHPDDIDAVKAAFQACVAGGGPTAMDYRRQTLAGDWIWLRSVAKIVAWDDHGQPLRMIGIHMDISSIKAHEQQLEYIAHYDMLTQLPNRVLLADRLNQAMAQSRRRQLKLAVTYVDLDGFKAINDHHGHAAGDQVLRTVSGRMKQILRDGDTLARLGGDEFVAVLLDLPDASSSVPLLIRLLEAVAQPLTVDDQHLQVSASVGVTFYPQPEEVDADQLLRQADQAMYQAKLAGKNRYHLFDAEQDRSVRGLHETQARLGQALDRGEFVLHYQPKVNLRTGALVGVEALIRWQHPELGLRLPVDFLPAVEESPLVAPLGEWVIAQALAQLDRWRAQGLDIPISVNISGRHLQRPDFVERLRVLLAAHPEVAPARLELEVLETSALEDLGQAARVLDACRELGVAFALDDFGTGYSSLTYLKRLAVKTLKIDRGFVHDMLDDPEDLAILEAIIGLAAAFRREVIAEGMETMAHGERLLALGCELAQGYAIARPMPAEALPEWLAGWRADGRWPGPGGD